MVSSPFSSRYRSSVDSSLQSSFGIGYNTGMAGLIANIVDVGGLRRRSSSSSRCSVSDDLPKRPSLLRNQATGEPSTTTYKESVGRSPSSCGRTRTATDILSRVASVPSQPRHSHSEFASPVTSLVSSSICQSGQEPSSPQTISSVVTDNSHSGVNDIPMPLSGGYFSFPSFGSWNGEDDYDREEEQGTDLSL
ncbi:hypothetical protein HOO65_090031 [Ceratocystis lukuohia]|uniref:Uncharacterized protein n=2 Tax=Ceratocystis TaxID=5157 RepID=A0A2C5WPS4_9PEZI|nr:hypothetical protein CFIMG_004933RA [Ceratocystis fimbriata CBS 114723]